MRTPGTGHGTPLLGLATLLLALGAVIDAQAGHQGAPPFSPRDYGKLSKPKSSAPAAPLTPAQRDATGAGWHLSHTVYEQPPCDLAALDDSLGPARLLPAQEVVVSAGQYRERRAVDEVGQISLQISMLMLHLEQNGDKVVPRHHLCVGLFNMLPKGPNAFAHPDGYIMVDPRLIIQLNRIKMPLLSSFEKFVYYHEFAHALQFWHPGLQFHDPTVRRAELAADCVAAGLAHSDDRGNPLTRLGWEQAFTETAAIYGDENVASVHHHGRPLERAKAVRDGINIVTNRLGPAGGSTTGITGDWLLRQCNATLQ